MSGQSEINRVDVISDELIAAPLKMAKDFEVLYSAVLKLKDVGKTAEVIASTAKASGDLAESTKNLASAQTELDKVQKAFATSTQKLGDEYISNKRALNEINEAAKQRLALGDRDTQSVNAQNASYKQLGAALAANRKMYQELNTEQQRNSKQGQDLLKVIQSQDKEFKALADQMKITNVHVGDYARGAAKTDLAMQVLDKTLGGAITSFKNLGAQFVALAANPFILVAAGLAAAFITLKEAAQDYYTHSLEGEDQLRREQFLDRARLSDLKEDWINLGKAAADAYHKIKESVSSNPFHTKTSEELQKEINLEVAAAKAADLVAKQFREHAKDRVDDAVTEIESNVAIAESKRKIAHTDQERLDYLRESNRLLEKQLKGDIELADNDIKAYTDELALSKKIIDGKKLVSEMSDDEIAASKLNGVELTKLATLQETRLKLESEAADKRANFYKRESALIIEMANERKAAAAEEERINKEKLDAEYADEVKKEKESVRLYNEFVQNQKDKAKELLDKQKDYWDKWVKDAKDANEKVDQEAQETFDNEQKRIKDEKDARAELIATMQAYADVTANAGMVVVRFETARSQAATVGYQNELKALDEKTKKEIEAAGDNDNAKKQIEKQAEARRTEIEKKIAAEKNKQAQLQHAADVIQGGVTFAKAVLEAFASPFPANVTLPAIVAAVAGLQLAAIIAAPIPKYEVGTKSAHGGLAIVGEGGAEAIKEPGKPWALTPGVATMMHVTKGAEIIPHGLTIRALALSALVSGETSDRQISPVISVLDDERIVKGLEHIANRMPDIVVQQAEILKAFKTREGNVKWIRAQIFGY